MGTIARRAALAVRLLLLTGVIAAMADPKWRLVSKDVATIMIVDQSRSMPRGVHDHLHEYVADALAASKKTDRLGAVTTAADALTQSLPAPVRADVDEVRAKLEGGSAMIGLESATDLASGVRLAMSMIPPDAAGRMTLVSDGNETQGSLLTAARAAAAAGVPIDVLPVPYQYTNEVIFDGLYAPATARKGQTINVRMSLTAKASVAGELTLMMGDRPVDLSPDDPSTFGQVYTLDEGMNSLLVPVTVSRAGPQEFRAFFEPIESGGDTIAENNNAAGVTFVSSEGRVLLLSQSSQGVDPLISALDESRIEVEWSPAEDAPRSVIEWQQYDAVILMDTPSYAFDLVQQKELAAYVRDAGGGLVMIGGPNSFGAGGWIGSPVAEVLPVLLDPPQKRQLPIGALAIVLDRSGSMSSQVQGTNMTQQRVATEAAVLGVQALSRFDYVTVIAFSDGEDLVVPLTPCTEPGEIAAKIRSIGPGGGTNMFPAVQSAGAELSKAPVSMKHIIVLTDGQTQGDPNTGLALARSLYQGQNITLSSVAIGDGANVELLRDMALLGNGRPYVVSSANGLATLPQIFIKEAQTVKRSLIWEGDAFNPKVVNGAAEAMRGIGATLPAISGYVVTADREGLALTTARSLEDDPLVAQWQHGLGRAVAFTSDSAPKWSTAWVSWGQYKQFWEQHVRWAMRPSGAANLNVATDIRGDSTHVIVTALDSVGDPLNFAAFRGAVIDPELKPQSFELTQTAPGRYEGDFTSSKPGTHIVTLRYDAAAGDGGAPDRGSVQAAVLRPFPDEYRALEDNTPLLQQVAELTGGRVLPIDDPANADLFSRDGLTMPVARRSIWLVIALASIGLFLADVAVRRVRIDIPAILAWARGLFRKKHATESQVDALRAARQTTRKQLAERAAKTDRPDPESAGPIDKSKKFEASPDQLKKPARSILDGPAPIVDKRGQHAEPQQGGETAKSEEGGMSRLLAAKRRAQDQMKDEDKAN